MAELHQIIEQFLAGQITGKEFETRFLELWRKKRDAQWNALESNPALHQAYNKWVRGSKFLPGFILRWWFNRIENKYDWHQDDTDKLLNDVFSIMEPYFDDDEQLRVDIEKLYRKWMNGRA